MRLTKTVDELSAWLKTLKDPLCVLAAGGDGSAIALVNALNRVTAEGVPFPPIGVLPLGTGNAWAHATGAKKLDASLRLLAHPPAELPTRRYGLVDCGGVLTHFAGSGWDAQILDDYKKQLQRRRRTLAYRVNKTGVRVRRRDALSNGAQDDPFRATTRHPREPRRRGLHDDRRPEGPEARLAGVKHGDVLYDGMTSVAAASTCPEFGYGFRAFPFAERMLGMINVRIYDRSAPAAIASIPKLWRGAHPLRGMHDWFTTGVKMTFSRPVPVQIGGDAVGMRQTIELRYGGRDVIAMLDWRRMA